MDLLIVDDEDMLRRALRRLLERQGISVVGEATNGEDGARLALELTPDAVLMDMRMPGMDGIAALSVIRASGSDVPVILHTAYADSALHEEAFAAGATRCIVKGAPPTTIKDTLLEIAA